MHLKHCLFLPCLKFYRKVDCGICNAYSKHIFMDKIYHQLRRNVVLKYKGASWEIKIKFKLKYIDKDFNVTFFYTER